MFSLEEARKRLYTLTPDDVSDMIDQALEESGLQQQSCEMERIPSDSPKK